MSALELARWQFGVTTVYHFLFVPITIGITWFVAVFQTLWHRRGEDRIPAPDALLRQADADQLRDRRRHRASSRSSSSA